MPADRAAAAAGLIGRGWPPPRLLALRLQGFKSFAERTNVEFGGGISAVVGPNGSGKSNLADALRWALGEQGRALRSRKAEDVIWAGSEKRSAQGMADVTLVLDNADGLLPVDFQVLELGRRLFRSGENEYLLNKQRIRLRDLVDLLDGAHLADNAFLFIGQGMVDQALALRPEERRPLFEEVAGVRRHERRRRKAEEQLAESEANLARVDDILAELRPQARRLAAQAEQQTTRSIGRRRAGRGAARRDPRALARGRGPARRPRRRGASAAQAEADRAMAELEAAEAAAAALAGELSARADVERERREAHEAARAALTGLQLRDGRLAADLEAIERDRARLADERAAAEAEAAGPAPRDGRAGPGPRPRPRGGRHRGRPRAGRGPGRAGDAAIARRRPGARSWPRCAGPRRPARPRPRPRAAGWPRRSGGLPRRRAAADGGRRAPRRRSPARLEAARRVARGRAGGGDRRRRRRARRARVALETAEAERAAAADRAATASAAAARRCAAGSRRSRRGWTRTSAADRPRGAQARRPAARRGPRGRPGPAGRGRGGAGRSGPGLPRRGGARRRTSPASAAGSSSRSG